LSYLWHLRNRQAEGVPIILCDGAGLNSVAHKLLLLEENIIPDLATFADLHSEKPETYAHLDIMDGWAKDVGFPVTVRVSKIPTDAVSYSNLEGNCVDNETLPSLAFGMKSCSIKWKQKPQDYYVKGCKRGPNKCDPHSTWLTATELGVKPIKLIGYDAGPADLRRSKKLKTEDDDFEYYYPLQEVGWDRADCLRTVVENDLPVPLKSACFFCPASKQWELWWLAGHHPDLFMRALNMEHIALTGHHSRYDEVEFGDSWENYIRDGKTFPSSNTTVGLGRSFAWNQFAKVNGIVEYGTRNECQAHGTKLEQARSARSYLTMKFIGNPDKLKAKADELMAEKGAGNALDNRTC